MKRYAVLLGILLAQLNAGAFAQDAPPLSKDELQQIVPGSKVTSTGVSGAQRNWTNDPDGTLIANASLPMGKRTTSTARGDWHVSDDGQYCVHIEWKSVTERWCVPIQKTAEGKYAMVKAANAAALPLSMEIAK